MMRLISLRRHLWAALLAMVLAVNPSCGQDGTDVLVSRASDDGPLLTRRGTVIDWQGGELVFDTVGGLKRVPNSLVVDVKTTWQPIYQQALRVLESRQMLEAIPLLARAAEEEPRRWAQHAIRADLVRCLVLAGQDLPAAQQFLQILLDDPRSRHIDVIPLSWGAATHDPHCLAGARQWIESSHPAISLLGASWLLGAPERPQAVQVLDELSRDIDPTIAHLASIQLWQIQVVSVDERTLARWQNQIERMPHSIQAGAHKVVAEGLDRLGRGEEAVLEWMKIPILHSRHYRLSLAGLEGAATILARQGDLEAARRLWKEVARDFPGTPDAERARQRLQLQEGNN